MDMGEAEPPADEPAVPEDLLDLVGTGVGGDVEVLGLTAEEQIAHPAADEVGKMTRLLEAVKDRTALGLIHLREMGCSVLGMMTGEMLTPAS